MTARRGHLLVEALCALALAGILAAAAAAALGGTRRTLSRTSELINAQRTGREATGVTSALLAAADSVTLFGDTAVEFSLRIGAGVTCAADSLQLWLPPSRPPTGHPLTMWTNPPEVGDEVILLIRDTLTGARWVAEEVDGASAPSPFSPCDAQAGWIAPADSAARLTSLLLRAPLTGAHAGAPVRVRRRGRLALYLDGRGDWMLGWRRCVAGACGVVQPVAGPLRTPAAGGFKVEAVGTPPGWRIAIRVPGSEVTFEAFVVRDGASS